MCSAPHSLSLPVTSPPVFHVSVPCPHDSRQTHFVMIHADETDGAQRSSFITKAAFFFFFLNVLWDNNVLKQEHRHQCQRDLFNKIKQPCVSLRERSQTQKPLSLPLAAASSGVIKKRSVISLLMLSNEGDEFEDVCDITTMRHV